MEFYPEDKEIFFYKILTFFESFMLCEADDEALAEKLGNSLTSLILRLF